MDCELLEKCGFFKKYSDTKALACQGFIKMYCKGENQKNCKRKEYREKHGAPPSEDMMPNGATIK